MSLWEVEILWARTAGGRRRLGRGMWKKQLLRLTSSVVESSLHENEINNNNAGRRKGNNYDSLVGPQARSVGWAACTEQMSAIN